MPHSRTWTVAGVAAISIAVAACDSSAEPTPDTAAATTVTATTVGGTPATEPVPPTLLAGPGPVDAGRAAVASVAWTERFELTPMCRSTQSPGVEVRSAVMVGDEGTIAMVDFYADEAGEQGVVVTDMNTFIGSTLFDQEVPGLGPQWTAVDVPFGALTDVTLDGPTGPLTLSLDPSEPADCATGFVAVPSPFGPGEQVRPVAQESADPAGFGFALLAECTPGGRLVSGAGILFHVVDDADAVSGAISFLDGDSLATLVSPFVAAPTGSSYERLDGGDTAVLAVQMEDPDSGTPGYLTWTDPPAGTAGFAPDVCAG